MTLSFNCPPTLMVGMRIHGAFIVSLVLANFATTPKMYFMYLCCRVDT